MLLLSSFLIFFQSHLYSEVVLFPKQLPYVLGVATFDSNLSRLLPTATFIVVNSVSANSSNLLLQSILNQAYKLNYCIRMLETLELSKCNQFICHILQFKNSLVGNSIRDFILHQIWEIEGWFLLIFVTNWRRCDWAFAFATCSLICCRKIRSRSIPLTRFAAHVRNKPSVVFWVYFTVSFIQMCWKLLKEEIFVRHLSMTKWSDWRPDLLLESEEFSGGIRLGMSLLELWHCSCLHEKPLQFFPTCHNKWN